jgi:hypothetical protein
MRQIFILIATLIISTASFAQQDSIRVELVLAPDTEIPFQTVFLDHKVFVLTVEQVRMLGMHAGRSEINDSLVVQLEKTDSLNRLQIEELNINIQVLKESEDAAIRMYSAERQKRLNNEILMRAKDHLIELQDKTIRRQKTINKITILVGTALVVAAAIL